jgi:DNA helicase-2/ATP-dependent DNA helicase PcrA
MSSHWATSPAPSTTSSTVSEKAAYLRAAEQLKGNEGQWAAYESKRHCVVLAGPGSGKTKTLAAKVARMLAEDVHEPRGLACITYNNECARELEDRLSALGVEPGGRVFIGTVHSFSLTQIILPMPSRQSLASPTTSAWRRKRSRDVLSRPRLNARLGVMATPKTCASRLATTGEHTSTEVPALGATQTLRWRTSPSPMRQTCAQMA